jgi:hypothetical protein
MNLRQRKIMKVTKEQPFSSKFPRSIDEAPEYLANMMEQQMEAQLAASATDLPSKHLNIFYVDSTRCLTALLNEPPKSRSNLFDLEPFASIADAVEAAELCYPLRWQIESLYSEIWDSLAAIVTDICGQDIAMEKNSPISRIMKGPLIFRNSQIL